MENIKSIVLFASVFSIVITILYNLSPEYNKSGQLKFISAIVYIILIITTIKNNKFNINFNKDAIPQMIISEEYTEEILQQEIFYETKTKLENNLLKVLKKENIDVDSIEVNLIYNDYNYIEINQITLKNCSNYNKARTLINQYFNDTVVVVNE
jgi:DNA-directed RNA polymerase specialized sigma54-like protein